MRVRLVPRPATEMFTYTIYDNPADYPGKFVVRAFRIITGGVVPVLQCVLADTLEEARTALPAGLVNVGRAPNDEPQIVETWL